MSTTLFTSLLEDIINTLNWDERGVNVSDRMLHLRFANDLLAENFADLETMLRDLDEASVTIGLEMNKFSNRLICLVKLLRHIYLDGHISSLLPTKPNLSNAFVFA